MMRKLALALAVLLCPTALCADQAADEAAIRKNAADYVAAYNNHDAKALANLWSPEAVYTNPDTGEEFVGRQAIADAFTAILAAAGDAKLAVEVKSISFLSPNVAVEQGTARITRAGAVVDEAEYKAVDVKRDGKWLLDRVTETSSQPSSYEQLKGLEWMVGEWGSDVDDFKVDLSCNWTKNRNFLTRQFSIASGGKDEFSGIQIIGWDPANKAIRSWTFDSNGIFSEGTWEQYRGQWSIRNRGTLPDGRSATMTNVMQKVDDDSFIWQTIERTAGDELLPNIDKVKISRR